MLATPEGNKPLLLRCVCSSIYLSSCATISHRIQYTTKNGNHSRYYLLQGKSLCSNMFCCVLSGRDHYKPNLGNDLWNKRTQTILSQLIQRLRFICHGPGHLLQALISVQIAGMAQRKVTRETQRGGAVLSILRLSPLSERLKLVTSIREFKIPRQL